jgi:DNA-binding CsgD family transcriptional regulator
MAVDIDIDDFNAVVSDIYEASLSPAHWDVALTGLIDRFSGPNWHVAMLVWERLNPAAGRFIGASGLHPIAREGYLRSFAGNNKWSVLGHNLPPGSVVQSDALVSREEFRQTSFYRNFLALFNMEVAILASLDRHGSDHLALCLPGLQDSGHEKLQRAVELLMPHMQRAVRISRRIGEAELAAANTAAALDQAPSAVLLLGEDLEILYANSAGQTLMQAFRLEGPGQRFRLADPSEEARIRALIQASGEAPCRGFLLRQEGEGDVAVMAMRIDPARLEAARTTRGAAQIMVVAALSYQVSEEAIERLREWYGLTQSEARLAHVLGQGGTLDTYSLDRGVSLNAARFLLKGVFAKTGTNRQAQLVELLARTPIGWTADKLPATGLPRPIAT